MREKFVDHLKYDWPKGVKQDVKPFTEKSLAHLPDLVQKHFIALGLMGQEEIFNAIIDWDKAHTRFSPTQKWVPVRMTQLNAVDPCMRFAWYLSKKFGFLPVLSGLENLCEGRYSLNVSYLFRQLACIPPKDQRTADVMPRARMALKAAMVQVLAEVMLVPGLALHPSITWGKVDAREVSARLTYPSKPKVERAASPKDKRVPEALQAAAAVTKAQGPVEEELDFVEGRFFVDKHGRMSRFNCEKRPFSPDGKEYLHRPWQYSIEKYETGSNVHFPIEVKSSWQLDNGVYEHFHGSIKSIRYNVRPAAKDAAAQENMQAQDTQNADVNGGQNPHDS